MPPRAIALMNSIRIKWIATGIGIEKLVMKQEDFVILCLISNLIITSRNVLKGFDFVQKRTDICKMKEKQTPNGLRLLLTFDDAKRLERPEKMQLLGGE
jgi:transcription-repair coupling factor (superfamily II helicase)